MGPVPVARKRAKVERVRVVFVFVPVAVPSGAVACVPVDGERRGRCGARERGDRPRAEWWRTARREGGRRGRRARRPCEGDELHDASEGSEQG